MPTAYCNLEQAYGEWDNEEIKNKNRNISHNQQNPQQGPKPVQAPEKQKSEENINVDFDKGNDIRTFCPNCKNCLDKNDALQQKVIDQVVWPKPRWQPQVPQSYAPFDPYNRYWAGVGTPNGREDFGNPYDTSRKNDNIEILLKITIFIVAVLFIILLVDILFKNKS
jgi:hypothetical protein